MQGPGAIILRLASLAFLSALVGCPPPTPPTPPSGPALPAPTLPLGLSDSLLRSPRGQVSLLTPQPTRLDLVDGRIEQSYTLHGDSLRTRLPGSRSHALPDGAVLLETPAGALRVDGLVAWDARGRPVPSRLGPSGDGFVARFDLQGATLPLTVDPWITAAPSWTADAIESYAGAGIAVALGDFDGDGTQDAALGLPGWDGALFGGGAVAIYMDVLNAAPIASLLLEGTRERGWFGASLAATDSDGDGYDELFVGAPGANEPFIDSGVVERFAGSTSGLEPVPNETWTGQWLGGRLGWVLTALEDLDGDGLGDVAAGAPFGGGADQPGVARVLLSTGALTLVGARPLGRFGAAFASGDSDGDGQLDLVVGAPGDGTNGAVHGYLGPQLATSPDWELIESGATQFGASVNLLDFDGDGRDDLTVGAPAALGGQGELRFVGPPSAPVILGSVVGAQSNAELGTSLLGVEDLDGDGLPDLLASEPGMGSATSPRAGGLAVLPAGSFPPSIAWIATGPAPHAHFGAALAGADVGGDGRSDLLVGGWTATTGGGSRSGTAWLLQGIGADEDMDGDGFCEGTSLCGGGLPPGDCDDTNPFVFPGALEICDGNDNDCNGVLLPEEADLDGDGVLPCEGDCDDTNPEVYPGAPEACDPIDRDCDGAVANGVTPRPRYADLDLDGFGADLPTGFGCLPPPLGLSEVDTDCDDFDPNVSPATPELICNGKDDDCWNVTPDAPDEDGDGFVGCLDCSLLPEGAVCGDCDDAARDIGPGAPEHCADGIDQDCDGDDSACTAPPPCLEPDNLCEEPGCACSSGSASASPLGLLPLLLLLARRRRSGRALLLLLTLSTVLVGISVPTPALAQDWDARGRLDTQLLRPSFAPWGWLGSPGAHPGLAGTVRAGVFTQYEHAPLALYDDDDAVARILRHRVTHTLGGWYSPIDGFGFGAALPLVGQQATWAEGDWSAAPFAPGDLQIDVLWRFAGLQGLDFGLGGRALLPTSIVGSLAGEATPRGELSLAAQGSVGPVTALLEVRGVFRKPVPTGYDLYLGNQLVLLGGVRLWPVPGRVLVQVEVEARAGFAKIFKGGAENPLDLRAGLRLSPARWLFVDIGGGLGLNEGYGTPAARALVGMTIRRLPQHRPPPEEGAETLADRRAREAAPPKELPIVVADLQKPPLPAPAPPEPEPEPVAAAAPLPLAELIEDAIVINAPIEFEQGSDALLPSSFPVLEEVRGVLTEHSEIAHLLVEGHASLEGRTTYNWDLSNRRAASVFRWLVEAGVSAARLSYRGMGEAVPRSERRAARVREEDRRVEFHVVDRLDPVFERVPDWDAEAPPIPWLMDDVDPLTAEDEAKDEAKDEPLVQPAEEAESGKEAPPATEPGPAIEPEPEPEPEPTVEPAPPRARFEVNESFDGDPEPEERDDESP